MGELTRRPGLMLAAVALLAHLSASGGYGHFSRAVQRLSVNAPQRLFRKMKGLFDERNRP